MEASDRLTDIAQHKKTYPGNSKNWLAMTWISSLCTQLKTT